jgi:hypothetical protein
MNEWRQATDIWLLRLSCFRDEGTISTEAANGNPRTGMLGRETCVPQSYAWGVEAQVDWHEAYADLAG